METRKGEWKVALDMGISHPPSTQKETTNFSLNPVAALSVSRLSEQLKNELLDIDQQVLVRKMKRVGLLTRNLLQEMNAYVARERAFCK